MRRPPPGSWDNHRKFCLGVFGASGTGKTTYLTRFLEAVKGTTCRFIFDADGEFSRKFNRPGVRRQEDIPAAIADGWVIYDPTEHPGSVEEAFAFFAALAYRVSPLLPGRKFFVVDELQDHTDGNKIPPVLKDIVQKGRRRGLDSAFISQAPNLLHNAVRGQLSEVTCFQMVDDRALEYPVNFGFREQEIRTLPQFHWVCRNKFGGEDRGR